MRERLDLRQQAPQPFMFRIRSMSRIIIVAALVLCSLHASAAVANPLQDGVAAVEPNAQAAPPQFPGTPQPSPKQPQRTQEEILERRFAVNLIEDQKAIWTGPLRLRKKDLFWLVPAGAVIGESLHRDAYAYRALTPAVNPGNTSKTFSDAGVVAFAGGIAGMYVLGRLHGNDHQRETAVLATEALANSMTVGYALKYALQRDRPFNGGQGDFFTQNGGTSFPSGHALIAWSMASVIAHEYPGMLTKMGVYGLASAVSLTRVTGRQHFPTDVLVGSAIGWGIGAMVYRKHHDDDLPGTSRNSQNHQEELPQSDTASPYVMLDSWIYPAMERLAALGLVHSASMGLRPWTRIECARLLNEAEDQIDDESSRSISREANKLISALKKEFSGESERFNDSKPRIRLDSVYARVTGVSGQPMTDGYHFGQSIFDDYGRPYGEGANTVAGFTGWITSGAWGAFLNGEFQYSPAPPSLTLSALQAAAGFDGTPVTPMKTTAFDRFRLLDTYVSFQEGNWQVSLGKQSQWWGPGSFGALNFSNNAEPILMLKVDRTVPLHMPSFLGFMGPTRVELIFGQMGGQKWVSTVRGFFGPDLSRQPLINAEKITFHPTPNLELGFSASTLWAGPGLPLTPKSFLRTYSLGNTGIGGELDDPGDRRAGFDFRYAVPWLRQWVVLYNDSFTEDEFSPIAYPRKSAMRSGIYLPRLPLLSQMDFRAEGVYTDLPNLRGTGVAYYNNRFRSGFTNFGQIVGDWVGREGSGFSAATTYWFSSQDKMRFSYRNINVNPDFIKGGRYDDLTIQGDWSVTDYLHLSVSTQLERWQFPIVSSRPQSDIIMSIGFVLKPRFR